LHICAIKFKYHYYIYTIISNVAAGLNIFQRGLIASEEKGWVGSFALSISAGSDHVRREEYDDEKEVG
jgi:hypothetical protein